MTARRKRPSIERTALPWEGQLVLVPRAPLVSPGVSLAARGLFASMVAMPTGKAIAPVTLAKRHNLSMDQLRELVRQLVKVGAVRHRENGAVVYVEINPACVAVEEAVPPEPEAPDPDAFLFRYGRHVLGERTGGGMVARLKKARGLGEALEALMAAARKDSPREYLGAVLRGAPAEEDERTPLDTWMGSLPRHQEQQAQALVLWARTKVWNERSWGPPIGTEGCTIEPEVLELARKLVPALDELLKGESP